MIIPIFRFPLCILLVACCLLVHSSCREKTENSKELARLDSALVNLKEAENIFLSVDTNSLRSSYNFAKEKLHSISGIISKDTVKKNTAVFLSEIYELSGNILNLLDNKKLLERAVKESKQRISDLKHDLNENLIEKNKAAGYVVNEMSASHKIYEAVNKVITNAKTSVKKLDSLKTEIVHIADSLQEK